MVKRLFKYMALAVIVLIAALRVFASEASEISYDRTQGVRCETVAPAVTLEELHSLIVSSWQSDVSPVTTGLYAAKTMTPVLRVPANFRFTPLSSGSQSPSLLSALQLSVQRVRTERLGASLASTGYYVLGLRKIII